MFTQYGTRRQTLACLLAAALSGQAAVAGAVVELPRRSARARVSQQVGLTEIAVDYFSPAVRGRSIWGAAVPYGQVWHSEENPGWRITFDKPVAFGDQDVPAGSYALLVIPADGEWTAVVNRDAGLIDGGAAYRPALDVARLQVTPRPAPLRERLTFVFSDFGDDMASLDLEWEKLRLSIPIRVRTREQVLASIRALDDTWRAYADAARYLGESKRDYPAALACIDRSIALEPNAYNTGIKSALLAARADSRRDKRRGLAVERARPLDQSLAMEGEIAPAFSAPPTTGPREVLPEEKLVPEAGLGSTVVPASAGQAQARAFDRGASAPSAARPANVSLVIKNGAPDVEGCHQRALRRDPALPEGRVGISVIVGTTGLARSVHVEAPPRLRGLAPCISDVVGRWMFPPAANEYVTEFPLSFHRRP